LFSLFLDYAARILGSRSSFLGRTRTVSSEKRQPKTAIILALIGLVGTLGAAFLASWDKIFQSNIDKTEQASVSEESVSPADISATTSGDQSPAIGNNSGEVTINYPERSKQVEEYIGEFGNFEKGEKLAETILNNRQKIVYFDAAMDTFGDNYQLLENTLTVDYFWFYTDCYEEPPSRSNCQGYEIFVDHESGDKDATVSFYRDKLRLKGYFAIKDCYGMHQGFEGCAIRPLNVDEVP
jgi:hypothetical protein